MISNLQLSTSETIDNLHNYTDLVVFTATLFIDDAKSRARFPACRRTLERARDLGLQVVLADNGSTSDFLNIIRSFSNVILLEYPKGHEYYKIMNPPRREALMRALNEYPDAKFFLWMEPEKADLITHENFDKMLTPMRNGSAHLVVPTPKPHDNRPEYMRMIENRANRRINSLLKTGRFVPRNELLDTFGDIKYNRGSIYDEPEKLEESIDRWFGPQLMTREIAQNFFLAKNSDSLWGKENPDKKMNFERQGWHIASGAIATKCGYPTKSIPIIFNYPQEQNAIESNLLNRAEYLDLRIGQYIQIFREYRRQIKRIIKG